MYIDFMLEPNKYQSKSYVSIFNFLEVQNIHPENKGNFHIKNFCKTNFK